MRNDLTFTILSVGATLVEVDGTGPTDRPSGLVVPNGVPTTDRVDLATSFERAWRVNAGPHATATIEVVPGDSSFDVRVAARRCFPPRWSQRHFAVSRWPRMRAVLKRHAPSLLALWYLYFDDDATACAWKEIESSTRRAIACGGDVVIVTFVIP